MQALNETSLPVRSLNLFPFDPETLGAGLPSRFLEPIRWNQMGVQALASLRALSVRVQEEPVADFQPGDSYEARSKKIAESVSFTGLVEFLKICPNLEELHLSPSTIRWYHPVGRHLAFDEIKFQNTKRVDSLDPLLSCKIPSLRILDLAGLVLNSDRFRDFLEAHSTTLRDLRLFHLVFRGSDLSWIFPLLASDAFALETIQLADLHDSWPLVFPSEGQEFTKIDPAGLERGSIHRWGTSTRKEIAFTRPPEGFGSYLSDQSYRAKIAADFGWLPWDYWREI
jgi:hypothetical protein